MMSLSQKRLLHASTLALAVSGLLYAALKYFGASLAERFPALFSAPGDPFTVVSHPAQPWFLDVHVLAAPIALFAVGWIFTDHISAGLHQHGAPSRRSGLAGITLFAIAASSGYIVQTSVSDFVHDAAVWAHVAGGLAWIGVYLIHSAIATPRAKGSLARPTPDPGGSERRR